MTPPIHRKSIIGVSPEPLAAVRVRDRHEEESKGQEDEDQIAHAVMLQLSPGETGRQTAIARGNSSWRENEHTLPEAQTPGVARERFEPHRIDSALVIKIP